MQRLPWAIAYRAGGSAAADADPPVLDRLCAAGRGSYVCNPADPTGPVTCAVTVPYAAEVRMDLAQVYLADRDWDRAATTASAVARSFAAMGARDLEARALAVLAQAKAVGRAPTEADAVLARAVELAATSESPLTQLAVDLARGQVLAQRGGADRRRGRALVQTTIASAQRQGLRGLVALAGTPPR